MGIKDQAKRVAAGASVALATSGLSSCHDNGAVDPLPPPLQCSTVDTGQSLAATATLTGDTVDVRITNGVPSSWRVDGVSNVSGGTLVSVQVPEQGAGALTVRFDLGGAQSAEIAFTVTAAITGLSGEVCAVVRTFRVTVSDTGVQVSLRDADDLPLPARQHAEIVLAHREGRVVRLEASTPWEGIRGESWSVSHGSLDTNGGPTVTWTLPAEPGVYQAELVLDFGPDGLAFDTLLLEVVAT
jgi:hypothetical protein